MEPAGSAFLQVEGIRPGATVQVLAIGGQGDFLLQAGTRQITMTGSLAANVMVKTRLEGAETAATK
jgi:Fe2+ transport system protein FeoA